jgi:hypothetical protein
MGGDLIQGQTNFWTAGHWARLDQASVRNGSIVDSDGSRQYGRYCADQLIGLAAKHGNRGRAHQCHASDQQTILNQTLTLAILQQATNHVKPFYYESDLDLTPSPRRQSNE